jgi:hypothetical protein
MNFARPLKGTGHALCAYHGGTIGGETLLNSTEAAATIAEGGDEKDGCAYTEAPAFNFTAETCAAICACLTLTLNPTYLDATLLPLVFL